jgi:hypothetical protein
MKKLKKELQNYEKALHKKVNENRFSLNYLRCFSHKKLKFRSFYWIFQNLPKT